MLQIMVYLVYKLRKERDNMEKKIPSKFKARIVAQEGMVQDVIVEATEFFDRRDVKVGHKKVHVPHPNNTLNMLDRFLQKFVGFKRGYEVYEDAYVTKETRGYDIWFYFGGKVEICKIEKSEVEKLIENGEWIIID